MRIAREDSMVWYVMHQAALPGGVTHADLPERFHKGRQNLSNSMMKLVTKGLLVSTKEGRYVRYTTTPEQLAKYVATGYSVGYVSSRTKLRVGQQRTVADWDDDTPPHFPVDADGKPLYKVTVAPKQPEPTRTNTHSAGL